MEASSSKCRVRSEWILQSIFFQMHSEKIPLVQVRNKTWKIGIVNASKQMGQSRTFRSSSAGESLLSGEDLEDRFPFCVRMLLAPSFSPETGTEAPTMVGGLTLHPRNLNPLYCFFFYCSWC